MGASTEVRTELASAAFDYSGGAIIATRFPTEQVNSLNGSIKPQLAALYARSAHLLSARGDACVERAIEKGTVGGDVGARLLFNPAMLLSLVAEDDILYELAEVAKRIPFIGNYNLWLPVEAMIAAAYRVLVKSGDPRATVLQSWLSLAENGGKPGNPVVHNAMKNRLNGLLVEQICSDDYPRPLKTAQFNYVMDKLRELSVMWAFGGSEKWTRERLEASILSVREQVSDYIAQQEGALQTN